ncbi:hypothetical protein MRB53_021056 [Persea americana]|uniref:Uncharacterized protein n=1 Tax=Persea americana TaxID=3435 RepID=A0ACC2L3X8_PERAE|nr:hypothetical protein MRB53_021056 [Persea americana]
MQFSFFFFQVQQNTIQSNKRVIWWRHEFSKKPLLRVTTGVFHGRYNVKLKGCCKDLVRDLKLIWYSSEINGKRLGCIDYRTGIIVSDIRPEASFGKNRPEASFGKKILFLSKVA